MWIVPFTTEPYYTRDPVSLLTSSVVNLLVLYVFTFVPVYTCLFGMEYVEYVDAWLLNYDGNGSMDT